MIMGTPGTLGTLNTYSLGPPRLGAGGTHIWCRRDSRIWREVSILKHKVSPSGQECHLPHWNPISEKSLFCQAAPLGLAPGSGTHRWLPRVSETEGGPSPHPGVSLGKEVGVKVPLGHHSPSSSSEPNCLQPLAHINPQLPTPHLPRSY